MEEKVLTHINDQGRAKMVDVGEKEKTKRIAKAFAKVKLNEETFNIVVNGKAKKGDVLAVSQVAGIMGAKKTSDIIPMCHPINLVGVDIEFNIIATTKCVGETGVEMEALSAVSIAALTIYDMCKAIQRDIEITDIKLLEKSGGKSGDFVRSK